MSDFNFPTSTSTNIFVRDETLIGFNELSAGAVTMSVQSGWCSCTMFFKSLEEARNFVSKMNMAFSAKPFSDVERV
jgi:hypothetical protein